MAVLKRKSSLILLFWLASLLAAFLIGRISPSQEALERHALLSSASVEKAPRISPVASVAKDSANASAEDSIPPGEGEVDPLEQMRLAVAETDALKRMALLADAMSRMDADNIEEALRIHDTLPDSNAKRQMYNLLLNTWGKLDGPAAMEYVMANSNDEGGRGRGGRQGFGGDGNTRDAMAVMSGWAEADPQNAILWAQDSDMEERDGRNPLMIAAMQGWANTDIRGALDFAMAQETSNGNRRGGGMEGFLINRFVNDDRQAATQWALSQYDPAVREEAVSSVARSMAGDDPQDALLWAQSLPDPESQTEALKGTVSGWVRENPVEAVEWAMDQENPYTSDEVVQSALNTWVRMDPYGAGEYVIEMETSDTRNSAAASLSQGLTRRDPEMAALWAETITDPKLQAKTAQSVYNSWTERRPEAASAWVQSSSLPEKTKKNILNPPEKD